MKNKVLIFPVILLFTFITSYLFLDYFHKKNEYLINRTKSIYIPKIELSINLHNKLTATKRSFQDIVISNNELILVRTDSIAKDFTELCFELSKVSKNQIFTDSVSLFYTQYYQNAKFVSKRMLEDEFSETLQSKITLMHAQYTKVEKLIVNLKNYSHNQANTHFLNIERNNRKSTISNVLIISLGLIVSIFVSYFYSKALAGPLRTINYELRASEEELRQMNEELSTTNDLLFTKNEELTDAMHKLKDTQLQLIQSEKMASIGFLTSGIAHEINNPLNFIQGGVTGIENYVADKFPEYTKDISRFIDWIKEGVERASNIVTSVSHFSRKADNATEQCDIQSIIDNCLVILLNKLKHKVSIKKEYFHKPIIVLGNEGRLHQCLLNILSNAEQAIEKKGIITIKTEIEQSKLKITITDTGYGIKKENILQITEPFFTTKAPGKGTGMGLSIAHSIIQKHKGSLKYESEFGKGTTVIIQLPAST